MASRVMAVGMVLAIVVGFSAHGFASDRRVSQSDLQTIADQRLAPDGIQVTVTPQIADRFNRLITAGRRWSRGGLARLESYRDQFGPGFGRHGIPAAMFAIPFAETALGGPVNQTSLMGHPGPRGIWQRTAVTARAAGLLVTADADQRHDAKLEIDAAAKLLVSLHRRFGDWLLVAAAYNAGAEALDRAIRKAGSRDPGRLVQRGLVNGYLTDVVAIMLLLQAPDLAQ
jgi:hypothetical protein